MIEQFKIMLLNRANKIMGIFTVFTRGVADTVADPRVKLATALKENASPISIWLITSIMNLSPVKQTDN
jgi:DNA repair protein RadC